MAPPNLLFSLLLSFLLVMLITKVESQINTTFNIDAFTPHSRLLTYERDAFVPPDTTYVRLVPGSSSGNNVGRVLYSAPVRLWEQNTQASFETTITFQITPLSNSPGAIGMTFFMVPVNSTTTTGGIFQNLGIYDAVIDGSAIFAVEFDIDPSLIHDPPYPHIGININSIRSQNTTRFDGATRTLVTARITYDVPTRMISVVATYGSRTATVSFAFNLKALLPQLVQVGLSASTSTGNLAVNYDAFTWHFNSTMVSDVNSVVVDDNTYIKQYVM
ncbi:hypothetical protein ACS0TY_007196 [Phlomoides rotata]